METAKNAFRTFVLNRGGVSVYGVPMADVYIDTDGLATQKWSKAILKYRPGSDPDNFDVESTRLI